MTKEAPIVRILHITDLHFKADRIHNQNVVLNALIKDLGAQSTKLGEPDLIIFSGDLVHSADDNGAYDKLYDVFIERLLQVTNCDHSRLYLVPGNHDLQRKAVESSRDFHDEIMKECTNRDTLNARYFRGDLEKIARTKSGAFFDFQEFFDSEGLLFSNEIVQIYDLPEKNISIIGLNTAWMGVAGLNKESDLRKLLLPEAALVEALEYIPENRFVIGAQHHPTNWLAEYCEADFKDFLGGKINLQLVGHVHDPRPIIFRDASGETFQNQAGALYTWREDRYLGYSLLRIQPERRHSEVCWRSYYDKRRCFDEATNINNAAGWLYSTEDAKNYFSKLFDTRKETIARNWVNENLGNHFKEEFERGLVDRPTSEVFVPPPLQKQVFVQSNKEEESDGFEQEEFSFSEFVGGTDNIFLQAYPEHGRTSLLQQLCVSKCNQDAKTQSSRHFMPVLLRFSDFNPGTKRVEKAIRDALPDLPAGSNVETLLHFGALTICIDDVVFSQKTRFGELKAFISKYKLCRYVISSQIQQRYDGVQVDTGLPVYFERVTLCSLRRKDIRSLVKKWDNANGSEEEVLEKVVCELRAINVPYTPVNSTLLLDIISNDQSFSPLNRPTLIERFVETLLKKRSLAEVERRKFDFRNHIHYLGHIAEYMCRENIYILDYDTLFRVTDIYLQNLGLNFGAREIIDNSIASRIFLDRKAESKISFRFRAFLEFFVAAQMRSSTDFREWIFEEERFLSYLNEIEYYAGLERSDLKLLQMVSDRHEKYTNDIYGDKLRVLLSAEGDQLIPKSWDENLRFAEELASQIREEPMSSSERDEVLDTDIPQDEEGRQEVFRPSPKEPQSKYILSLMMYTTLVKNTELIADADKREHLEKVLRSWSLVVLGSFLAIPSLVKNRKMNVNGLNYTISYPKEFSDERVAKLISVNIPKEIARLLFLLIGTEKLEVQLNQAALGEANEPKLVEFFRYSLCMDLKFGRWWKLPRIFNDRMKGNHYFREVMLAKAADVYQLGAFSKQIQTELQGDIVDSYARLYASDTKQIESLRNKKKTNMQRRALLNAMKTKIDK